MIDTIVKFKIQNWLHKLKIICVDNLRQAVATFLLFMTVYRI